MNESHGGRRLACVAVVLLTLAALAARLAGNASQLPHAPERVAILAWQAAARELPAGHAETPLAYRSTFYPFLFSGLLVSLPGHSYPQVRPASATLDEHLAAAAEPYRRARLLIALLSVLAVPATYLLARRWLERSWAFFAALLMATSFVALCYGSIARPHAAVGGLSACALVAALWVRRSVTIPRSVIAACAAGLCVASLHSGVLVVPSVMLAHLLGRGTRAKRWIGLSITALVCAASFVLAYPFALEAAGVVANANRGVGMGEQRFQWSRFNGAGYVNIVRHLSQFEPVLLAAAVLGLLFFAARVARGRAMIDREHWKDWIVVACHPVLAFAAFGMLDGPHSRFVLPTFPCLALLGAFGARQLARRLVPDQASATTRGVFSVALATAILALPTYACARLIVLQLTPDTQTAAVRWLDEHARADEPIAMSAGASLPIFEDRDELARVNAWMLGPWQLYQLDLPPEVAAAQHRRVRRVFRPGVMSDQRFDASEVRTILEDVKPTWVVLALNVLGDDEHDATHEVLRAVAGEPVVRFVPIPIEANGAHYVAFDPSVDSFSSALHADRIGPLVEIYRLPDTSGRGGARER